MTVLSHWIAPVVTLQRSAVARYLFLLNTPFISDFGAALLCLSCLSSFTAGCIEYLFKSRDANGTSALIDKQLPGRCKASFNEWMNSQGGGVLW